MFLDIYGNVPVCEVCEGRGDMSPCVLVSGPGWMLGPEKVFLASRDHIPGPALARPQPDTNMAKEFGCPTFPQLWPSLVRTGSTGGHTACWRVG